MDPAAAMAVWRSPVYNHYNLGIQRVHSADPVSGMFIPDHIVYTFTCRYDPDNCAMRKRKRKATGAWGTQNLLVSIRRCNQRRGVPDNKVNDQLMNFSQATFRAVLATWCAVSHRPFHTVSDPLFVYMVRLLRPDTWVPTPQTVSSDLIRIYGHASVSVTESLSVCSHLILAHPIC
jgi:hypothetical protein